MYYQGCDSNYYLSGRASYKIVMDFTKGLFIGKLALNVVCYYLLFKSCFKLYYQGSGSSYQLSIKTPYEIDMDFIEGLFTGKNGY